MNALPLSLQFLLIDFDNVNTREKVADCVCLLSVCDINLLYRYQREREH